MTLVDFLWVFICGGYFGWTVHELRTRHVSRRTNMGGSPVPQPIPSERHADEHIQR